MAYICGSVTDALPKEMQNMFTVELFEEVFTAEVLPLDLMQVVLCMCVCVFRVFVLRQEFQYLVFESLPFNYVR